MAQLSQRILVVDDDFNSRRLMRRVLEYNGFTIYESANGEEALVVARQLQPNLILMDLIMPRLDGWEAIRQLRAIPLLANTPIIVISANVLQPEKQRAFDVGCNEFLAKPYDIEVLLEQVKKWLDPKTMIEKENSTE
jgi:two-component system, cell cycle response regulator DivK